MEDPLAISIGLTDQKTDTGSGHWRWRYKSSPPVFRIAGALHELPLPERSRGPVNIRVISPALVEPSQKGSTADSRPSDKTHSPPAALRQPPDDRTLPTHRRLECGAQLPADCNRLFWPAAQLLLSPARIQILCDCWQRHRFRQSSRHATPHGPDQVKRLRQFAPRR